MLTLVVARYNEDVSWLNLVHANAVIVDKAQVGNTGREAASYLWFITNHYESLSGDYLFCQGDPFAHCPDFDWRVNQMRSGERHFGPRVRCDWEGAPHHPGLPLREMVNELVMAPAEELEFTAGAQFMRAADEIQERPRWLYRKLLERANEHPQAPWCFERLWDYLIPTPGRSEMLQHEMMKGNHAEIER